MLSLVKTEADGETFIEQTKGHDGPLDQTIINHGMEGGNQ